MNPNRSSEQFDKTRQPRFQFPAHRSSQNQTDSFNTQPAPEQDIDMPDSFRLEDYDDMFDDLLEETPLQHPALEIDHAIRPVAESQPTLFYDPPRNTLGSNERQDSSLLQRKKILHELLKSGIFDANDLFCRTNDDLVRLYCDVKRQGKLTFSDDLSFHDGSEEGRAPPYSSLANSDINRAENVILEDQEMIDVNEEDSAMDFLLGDEFFQHTLDPPQPSEEAYAYPDHMPMTDDQYDAARSYRQATQDNSTSDVYAQGGFTTTENSANRLLPSYRPPVARQQQARPPPNIGGHILPSVSHVSATGGSSRRAPVKPATPGGRRQRRFFGPGNRGRGFSGVQPRSFGVDRRVGNEFVGVFPPQQQQHPPPQAPPRFVPRQMDAPPGGAPGRANYQSQATLGSRSNGNGVQINERPAFRSETASGSMNFGGMNGGRTGGYFD